MLHARQVTLTYAYKDYKMARICFGTYTESKPRDSTKPLFSECLGCSASRFSALLHVFESNDLSSTHSVQEKKGGVVRTLKDILHKL